MARRRALDLNRPKDAKTYVLAWVDKDALKYEEPLQMLDAEDEDYLRVAKQLFLYVDARQPLGDKH